MKQDNAPSWAIHHDEQDIVWLTIDCADTAVNTLSQAAIQELGMHLDELNIMVPKGIVIQSAKANGFIAGADIEEFTHIKTEQEAQDLMDNAHRVFNQLEALPCHKVALIHGFCLGGGLELALACDTLIAEDLPSCKLGLPEVKLGIHPGFGGSVRLIERIGAPKAMGLMLAGRVVVARAAKKLGFVDQVIARRYFHTAASQTIHTALPRQQAPFWLRSLNTTAVRSIMARYLHTRLAKHAHPDHYPAPFALINLWRQYGGNRDHFLQAEAQSVANLVKSDTARQLVRLFFLQESLKKAGKSHKLPPIKQLHVIGAGVMGGDIAAWSALRGIHVTLQDQNPDTLARAMQRARALFQKKLKLKRLVQAAMDRLTPDPHGNGVTSAGLIIEAIFENLEAKQTLMSELEPRAKDSAILASNTSSIPIESIASALKKPSRLVGIHFFNPVAKMQLVEIVTGTNTSDHTNQSATAFAVQINRLPVAVKSSTGFLVNRVLMPYLMEAALLLDEGIDAPYIDQIAVQFGMPMGPIELADVVGLDVCQQVASHILPGQTLPKSLTQRVERGNLGKKSGQGFYSWSKGQAQKTLPKPADTPQADLIKRLIYPLLNECIACLREGVVSDADQLDAGIIFGTGFAPFKGGPIQTIAQIGAANIQADLSALMIEHGSRFTPDPGWAAYLD